jgi:hypothetical protein
MQDWYYFHCKKCGFYVENLTKSSYSNERSQHERDGCQLEFAEMDEKFVLVRKSLAEQMRAERDLKVQEYAKEEINPIENPYNVFRGS